MMQSDLTMPRHSVYVPVLIGLVALAGLLGFQCVELWQGHGGLIAQRDSQTAAVAESDKMRRQLVTLATKTAELAQQGDADAKAIVDEYAKRGLNFVPPRAPAGTPAPKP
jgi:hypothetical protein